jgi:NAD+ synthase
MIEGLKIGIAQVNPIVGNLKNNLLLMRKVRDDLKDFDLIVFPELIVCGYPPEDLVLKPSFVQQCRQVVEAFAAESQNGPAMIVTTPWEDNGKIYNAAMLVQNGTISVASYKNALPNYGVFDELRTFAAGPLPAPITVKGHKLGIVICEDMWFPEVSAHLKSQGAEALIVSNGSPYDADKISTRLRHARARVQETGLPLLYLNQLGGQDDLVFDGGSFGLNKDGVMNFVAPFFKTYIGDLVRPPRSFKTNELELTYSALRMGLRDYVGKNNFPGVIIGMSGGIDSAISAAIAVDALGPERVRCVMLPSEFTSQESLDDAQACASQLGVTYETISIKDLVKTYEQTIPDLSGLAHENIQSRIRGDILMALSNQTGWMVLTTGNKSEMAVGYATLYGDMCGGYNVLKDVYKTTVYQLAAWRNQQSPMIPQNILTKAPTAELRPNQTDQDSLPAYEVLDTILAGLIERDLGIDDLVSEGHERETVVKIMRLLDLAEYKRRQSAPGVKISTRSFGRERRYPITNGHRQIF